MKRYVLNDGTSMPAIGLGTFQIKGEEGGQAIRSAVENGYTMFDSAASYRNSELMGDILSRCFEKREDYYFISKLSNRAQRDGDVRKALTQTLQYLHMDYVDMYLMHWPNPGTFVDCYQQMVELEKEGLVRSIGVCNFHEHHLEELLKHTERVPSVNQVELHPLLNQHKLADYCAKIGITMMSYSPFARMHERLIEHPVLVKIANHHNVKVVQIIVRWNYQHGYVVIPKSANRERQRDNISIDTFELTEEEMLMIDEINEDFRVRHNPDTCDFMKL